MKSHTYLGGYVSVCYIQVVNSSCRFGFTVEKVTPDYFQVLVSMFRNPIMCLASLWEWIKLRVIAEGDDWGIFL